MSREIAARKDAVLPVELATAPPREHDFALVVGVEHYPRFRSLRGAAADAQAFHAWVCSPDGGAVPADNARLVVSTEEPVAPLQDQIDDALEELILAADRASGGRRLYFYFSGHGATDDTQLPDNVALLLAKWSLHRERVALSSSEYWGKLAGLGLFEEIAVFLDCCRSTARGAVGLPPTVALRDRMSVPRPTKTFIAFAAEAARPAFELPVGGLWQGVFTRRLLAILRGSPAGIAAAALKDRLEGEVPDDRAGQRAEVKTDFRAAARFGRRGTLPELHITFRRARNTVTLLDGALQPIASHTVTAEPWVIPLASGLYLLSDSLSEQSIKHQGGEVTDVEF